MFAKLGIFALALPPLGSVKSEDKVTEQGTLSAHFSIELSRVATCYESRSYIVSAPCFGPNTALKPSAVEQPSVGLTVQAARDRKQRHDIPPSVDTPMTRSIMHKRDDPETASTSPTIINSLPLIKAVSHGVEEAVDKEKAMQEVEAERDGGSGEEGDGAKTEPDVYDRFPKSKKRIILFIVSYAAFLGRESSSFLS